MVNIIIFILIVIAIIVITIMYLKSIQVNNTETRYNIVMRLLIVALLTVLFLENKIQTGMLSSVSNSIATYLSDAGKSMMLFIDDRTKDINERLNSIENKTDNINNKLDETNKDISSINQNISDTKIVLSNQINSVIQEIENYIQSQINKFIEDKTGIGPGGIQVIW